MDAEKTKSGSEFSDSDNPLHNNGRKRAIEFSADDDKKNRGNYRCSRCNLPKKGHVCPFQPVFKRRDVAPISTNEVGCQAELDCEMTLTSLGDLRLQGTDESYKLNTQ